MRKTLLLILFLVSLAIVIVGWFGYSGSLLASGIMSDWLLAAGRLFGLLAVFSILWQLILISRFAWLEKAISLDKVLVWHHINGLASMIFIIGHPILLGLAYSDITKNGFWATEIGFIVNWEDVFGAFIGFILFVAAVALSIKLIKKKLSYELWYLFHLLIYVAIIVSFGHQLAVGGDFIAQGWYRAFWIEFYAVVIALLIIFRWLRPVWSTWHHRFEIDKVVEEASDVYSLHIGGRNMDNFNFSAGQFVIVRFLTGKHWWQAHPFSISNQPNNQHLRLTIKSLGDHTKAIRHLLPGVKVMIDGPHGAMTTSSAKKDKFLLVAGGIGITPLRSLAEELVRTGKEVILVYANKTQANQVFMNEFSVWPTDKFHLHAVYSQGDNPQHVDEDLIKSLVQNIKDYEVYVCGPASMMKAVRDICLRLGLPKKQYHWEKFSF